MARPETLGISTTKLLVALALVGCGASDPDAQAPTGPVTSNAGVYVGEFSFQPSPPAVGENHLSFHLMTADSPVVGAVVQLESYMPAHGHTATANVSEVGDGDYATGAIVYNMPGTWELTIEIAADAGTDAFALSYDVH